MSFGQFPSSNNNNNGPPANLGSNFWKPAAPGTARFKREAEEKRDFLRKYGGWRGSNVLDVSQAQKPPADVEMEEEEKLGTDAESTLIYAGRFASRGKPSETKRAREQPPKKLMGGRRSGGAPSAQANNGALVTAAESQTLLSATEAFEEEERLLKEAEARRAAKAELDARVADMNRRTEEMRRRRLQLEQSERRVSATPALPRPRSNPNHFTPPPAPMSNFDPYYGGGYPSHLRRVPIPSQMEPASVGTYNNGYNCNSGCTINYYGLCGRCNDWLDLQPQQRHAPPPDIPPHYHPRSSNPYAYPGPGPHNDGAPRGAYPITHPPYHHPYPHYAPPAPATGAALSGVSSSGQGATIIGVVHQLNWGGRNPDATGVPHAHQGLGRPGGNQTGGGGNASGWSANGNSGGFW